MGKLPYVVRNTKKKKYSLKSTRQRDNMVLFTRGRKAKKIGKKISTVLLIHASITAKRNIIPHNIELVTFVKTGKLLRSTTVLPLLSLLRQYSNKLDTMELTSINKSVYSVDTTIQNPDGSYIQDELFIRYYKPNQAYPEHLVNFDDPMNVPYNPINNNVDLSHTIGFFKPESVNITVNTIDPRTGIPDPQYPQREYAHGQGMISVVNTKLLIDLGKINVNPYVPFNLQLILQWMSNYIETEIHFRQFVKRNERLICRIYLLSCQENNKQYGTPTQNMNLDTESSFERALASIEY